MKHKRYGFTIVELLIVIVVIAILAAISIVTYNGIQQRAYASKAASALRQAATMLESYGITHGVYPASSCLGPASYYQAEAPFGANNCIVGTDPTDTSTKTEHYGPIYSEAVNQALGTDQVNVEWPFGEEIYPGSYALVNRGIFWNLNHGDNQSGVVGFVMRGKVSCPSEATSDYHSTSDVTYCRIYLNL